MRQRQMCVYVSAQIKWSQTQTSFDCSCRWKFPRRSRLQAFANLTAA